MNTLEAIHKRRSVGRLVAPAPSPEDIKAMMRAAVAAPDHDQLRPWRFIVVEGQNKDQLADLLVKALLKRQPNATGGQLEKERNKLSRAPMVIVAATKNFQTKIPLVEMMASTAAAIQNLLLAATELGYSTMWRTGEVVYDPLVKKIFGLNENDEIAGFIYIGTSNSDLPAREAPQIDDVVSYFQGSSIAI